MGAGCASNNTSDGVKGHPVRSSIEVWQLRLRMLGQERGDVPLAVPSSHRSVIVSKMRGEER
jgi:hypothetical protein